ncbi:MAG: hypothetical protein U0O03_15945, partial [Blautia wexlerae]
ARHESLKPYFALQAFSLCRKKAACRSGRLLFFIFDTLFSSLYHRRGIPWCGFAMIILKGNYKIDGRFINWRQQQYDERYD